MIYLGNEKKIYEEYDATDVVGQSLLEDNLKFKVMQNGLFKLSLDNVKSGFVYGVLWALLSVLIQIQQAGTLIGLNWKSIGDAAGLGFIAVIITLLKNLFTTNKGNFLGVVSVVPPVVNEYN